jgi:hypothetical protein
MCCEHNHYRKDGVVHQAHQVRTFFRRTLLLKRRALITCIYSGYICISLPGDRLEELELPLMVPNNEEKHKTAYTLTVDYKHGG